MKLFIAITFFLTFVITIQNSLAISCTIRSGSCSAGETCLFSMYQRNDSHVGDCNAYDYKVCCNTITSATIKNSCAEDESGILSLYSTTDSHVEEYGYGNYNNHICIKPSFIKCKLRSSCLPDETAVVSLYSQTDSHVAEPEYFNYQLCCYSTARYITITLNSSKAWWLDGINASGRVYNASGGIQGLTVNIKIAGETKCSSVTDSEGRYNCSFTAPNELGSYVVLAEAEDTYTSATLTVAPNYGSTAIGTANRVVYEQPMLIQDLNGKIKKVWVRIMVWKS